MANNSPMEFLHQIFVKLGARYAIITNTDGLCQPSAFILVLISNDKFNTTDEGIIDKKTWLVFLGHLEEKS